MKKIFAVILAFTMLACCTACGGAEKATEGSTVEGSEESKAFDITEEASSAASEEVGEASSVEESSEEWLDKSSAAFDADARTSDLTITEIRDDCFFARYITPLPQEFKINGSLGDEWCVGDNVLVEYNKVYTDGNRIEGELLSIVASSFVLEPWVDYKPVIYLYPEVETDVSVTLELDGDLTCTYPAYNDGWSVTAFPDGTLTDSNGQSYSYLYWEGETFAKWDMSRGFCIKGEDTAAFLEKALAKLGLNRREANEFIVFWLPLMQNNAYNLISFQTAVYTESAKLEIVPSPDTLIRVFMAYRATDSYIDIEPQELSAPDRQGFVAVEWGGTVID